MNEASIIPQNLSWRAGITPTQQSPIGDPGQMMAQTFVQGLTSKAPKVELPPIKKSKRDQYIDALLNNGVVWKTGPEDTRPETQAELIAQQNPQMITEPLIDNKQEYAYTPQVTNYVDSFGFLPNIQL